VTNAAAERAAAPSIAVGCVRIVIALLALLVALLWR